MDYPEQNVEALFMIISCITGLSGNKQTLRTFFVTLS